MESELSNCCIKIPKKIIGCLGVAFSFALVGFFGFVFMILEVRLIFAVLLFFSNLVASFFWYNGLDVNRSEFSLGFQRNKFSLMMASLVCWGLQLNLWMSYLFLIVLKNAFENQYPGLIDLRDSNDKIIFVSTVFFFVGYLLLIFSYVSIKSSLKGKNPQTNIGWKIAGLTAVWLLTSFAIAQSIMLGSSPIFQNYNIWLKRVIFGLHSIAVMTWACGMIKNKSEYLLTSLICWFLPLTAFLGTQYRELYDNLRVYDKILWNKHLPVFEVTAFYISLCFIAMLSYFSMRRDFQRQQSSALYTAAPTENIKEIDV